jgi:hypothetical protein
MKKKLRILSLVFVMNGCAKAEFDAVSDVKRPAKSVTPPDDPKAIETPKTPLNPDEIFDNTPNDKVMNRCFKEWGETPFDSSSAKNYRVLTAQSTGFGAREIADRANTKQASLVLIKVTVEGFTSINLDLGNPNGWYCIDSSATGFTSLTIRKHCRATIGNLKNQMTGFGGSETAEYGDGC